MKTGLPVGIALLIVMGGLLWLLALLLVMTLKSKKPPERFALRRTDEVGAPAPPFMTLGTGSDTVVE